MLSPHDIRDPRKVIPIHEAIPARLSPEYRKGMQQIVTEGLAAEIAAVSQALDFNSGAVVQYESLAPAEQARANDAARCAVKWCDPREHRDAVLRLRQEITTKLFAPDVYHRLPPTERQLVAELADACHATLRLHFEGIMSPLSPMERSELEDGSGEAA